MAPNDVKFTLPFQDRSEAGHLLARRFGHFANRSDVVVLALPRGGIPVGAPIAAALKCPLRAFVVRKLGVPGQPELAMGAIASGGTRLINSAVASKLHIPDAVIEAAVQRETQELARRERLYRRGQPLLNLQDKIVILTDDGVATGSSMMLAAQAIRQQGAGFLVVAIPVAPPGAVAQLAQFANQVVCLAEPEGFGAVGEWYRDFHQLDDHEVCQILDQFLDSVPEPQIA